MVIRKLKVSNLNCPCTMQFLFLNLHLEAFFNCLLKFSNIIIVTHDPHEPLNRAAIRKIFLNKTYRTR